MNLHVLADRATAVLGGLFAGRNRFFARSVGGPTLPEVVDATRVEAVRPDGEGIFEAPADTPAGSLDSAFRVARWLGPDRPTLIYNQGSGERSFDFSSRSKNTFRTVVLDAAPAWHANLIVVRAPFHAGSQRDYARAMGDMIHFTSMIAAMVAVTDHLVTAQQERGDGRVVVAGISLGGWVTNLHAACFGTADVYSPLLAGAALDDLFLRSSYRRLTADRVDEQSETVTGILNFARAFRQAPADRVFPLLAEHDQFIRLEPQTASYGDVTAATLDRGHVTAAGSPALLRAHLAPFVVRAA